jgi:HMG (high mobility group) box
MGQTLSAPSLAPEADGWPSLALATQNSPLPSQLPPYNTTILNIGHVSGDVSCTWHVQGGHLRFPIPPGFKASSDVFDQKINLSVEQNGTTCLFRLQTERGEVFTGATPTAPFAKWALSLGKVEIPNGLEAFGFTNTQVQAILRQLAAPTGKVDALVAHLEPGTAVGAWARQEPQGNATPTSGVVGAGGKGLSPPSLLEEIQREAQRIAHPHQQQQRAPSLAPSLHNWLSVGLPETSPKSPSSKGPNKRPATSQPSSIPILPTAATEGVTYSTPMASTPFSSFQAQQGGGLPPRPASRPLPSNFAPVASPEAHAAVLVNRPASRSRSGALSSGRGWTAFTAFGLQTRDAIREANPYASATEIEKMVGRQWASLTPEGKQHYADVAAEVRRSSQGNLGAMGSAELRTEMAGAGFGVGGVGAFGAESAGQQPQSQHQNSVFMLARTRSDAASEERQLRPSRRPKLFGPEYDTSDAPLPGRKGSVWESEIDRVYTDILAIEEAERVAAERAAAKAVRDAKASQKRKGAAAVKKEKEAEVEADVLGVLADMRAEVLASGSKSAGSGAEKSGDGGDGAQGEVDEGASASEKMVIKTAIASTNGGQEALSADPGGHHLAQEEQ